MDKMSIDYVFKAPRWSDLALAYLDGRGGTTKQDSERLEFVGDRILALVIADYLYENFSNEREGEWARRLAHLVSGETCAAVTRGWGLRGQKLTTKMRADICEAVLGAIYYDGGLEVAREFILRHWVAHIEALGRVAPKDSKTALQEWSSGRGLGFPSYCEVSREGAAHDPLFTYEVEVAGRGCAQGRGKSRRVAEQAAAKALLTMLEGDVK